MGAADYTEQSKAFEAAHTARINAEAVAEAPRSGKDAIITALIEAAGGMTPELATKLNVALDSQTHALESSIPANQLGGALAEIRTFRESKVLPIVAPKV
jgi:hypothetical protein